jgi:alkylated DNA repair dioxygenase AlkB
MEFPDSSYHHDIPGLFIEDDFVTEEESKSIKTWLDSQAWTKLMNRRVQHYGYEFVYGANNINKNEKIREMPQNENETMNNLNNRINDVVKGFFIKDNNEAIRIYDHQKTCLVEDISLSDGLKNYFDEIGEFDQLTVNDYNPGQGIPPHIDHNDFQISRRGYPTYFIKTKKFDGV